MSWKLEYCYDKVGSGKGEFEYARGICVSETTGNLTIGDISNKRIQVLNPHFEPLYDWNIEINGSLLCPLDVHRVNENVLAAVVEGHATLWQCEDKIDYSGTSVTLLHSFGNKEIVFPRSITQLNGNFLITDVGKHRLSLYDQNGILLKTKGTLGTDDAINFNWPYYTCTDNKERLAVSDSHNQCVKLFDRDLNYISCFGKEVLKCCAGVAFSKENGGRFFVVEYDEKKLYEFSIDGKLIQCIDEKMKFPGQKLVIYNDSKLLCTMHHGFFVYSK